MITNAAEPHNIYDRDPDVIMSQGPVEVRFWYRPNQPEKQLNMYLFGCQVVNLSDDVLENVTVTYRFAQESASGWQVRHCTSTDQLLENQVVTESPVKLMAASSRTPYQYYNGRYFKLVKADSAGAEPGLETVSFSFEVSYTRAGKHCEHDITNSAPGTRRADFVGSWVYPADGTVFCRQLLEDGSAQLYRADGNSSVWTGNTWSFDAGEVTMRNGKGSIFGRHKLEGPDKLIFFGGESHAYARPAPEDADFVSGWAFVNEGINWIRVLRADNTAELLRNGKPENKRWTWTNQRGIAIIRSYDDSLIGCHILRDRDNMFLVFGDGSTSDAQRSK